METTRITTRQDDITTAEQLLRDAGFTFETVPSCPDPNCAVCVACAPAVAA